jgi:hypothetical protein
VNGLQQSQQGRWRRQDDSAAHRAIEQVGLLIERAKKTTAKKAAKKKDD